MKRIAAIALAVLIFFGTLTACSGSATFEDGHAYGNISTTPDGRVNGSNPPMRSARRTGSPVGTGMQGGR